jgi:hypothetical protein
MMPMVRGIYIAVTRSISEPSADPTIDTKTSSTPTNKPIGTEVPLTEGSIGYRPISETSVTTEKQIKRRLSVWVDNRFGSDNHFEENSPSNENPMTLSVIGLDLILFRSRLIGLPPIY